MARKRARRRSVPRITLQDVANAAGVSLGAASAALQGSTRPIGVSRETRERVLRIARELNYRPHAGARALAGHSFKTIGVLAVEHCFGSYFSHVLRAIVTHADTIGYDVIVKMVSDPLDLQKASIFREELIDGVIVPAESEPELRKALYQFSIPHVWAHAGFCEPYNCVQSDEQQGLDLLVEHLVSLGHRRIAYIPHDEEQSMGFHLVATRRQCYAGAMRRHDLPPMLPERPAMHPAEAAEYYSRMRQRPTALVAYSDALAARMTAALLDRGLRIPDDISVVGNEGVIWHLYAHPPLTTACAPVHELGRSAVEMLVEQLRSGHPVESVCLPQKLEVHQSTGPAPQP
jgi:LacI family transcriptional regulator